MKTFSYSGAESSGVLFPLGGIGTGSVGICSNGSLKLDEICNSFGGSDKSGAFFALKSETVSGNASVRIIEARAENLKEKSSDSRGNALLACGGGFEKNTFTSYFPFADLAYEDVSFPAKVTATAFNPFIPLNCTDSGIPAAFFSFSVENTSDERAKYSLCAVLESFLPNTENKIGCTEDEGAAYILMSGKN